MHWNSSEDPHENWTVFRDTVNSSAMDSLGPLSRKHQDWFDENDEEIQGLHEEKHQKHKAYLNDTSSVSGKIYSNICKTIQTRLSDTQDSLLSKTAGEIQPFADRKDIKKIFDALKTVYGPQISGTTPILSADGNSLLNDKEAVLIRMAEHFDGILNRPSPINEEATNRCDPLLDDFLVVSETVEAIKLLPSGKAPGSDADLQSRMSSSCRETSRVISHYVEKRSHPSRIEGCNNYPPIQKERESSSL